VWLRGADMTYSNFPEPVRATYSDYCKAVKETRTGQLLAEKVERRRHARQAFLEACRANHIEVTAVETAYTEGQI